MLSVMQVADRSAPVVELSELSSMEFIKTASPYLSLMGWYLGKSPQFSVHGIFTYYNTFLAKCILIIFLQYYFTDQSLYIQYIYIYIYIYISSECSAQGQVFHCKLGHQGRSSAQRQVFHHISGTKVAVLLGMNRCGSFSLLSAPHSLISI